MEPIKVVRGNPTPEELAAALAVVQARAAGGPSEDTTVRTTDEWASHRRALPRLRAAGRSAWRTTYWPV